MKHRILGLAGAATIICIDRVRSRLDLALEIGATHVIDAGAEDVGAAPIGRGVQPGADEGVLAGLGASLRGLAPSLEALPVTRFWCGLRTFAPDRGFVLGPDPRRPDLFWLAGLGGHGMTTGLAVGALAEDGGGRVEAELGQPDAPGLVQPPPAAAAGRNKSEQAAAAGRNSQDGLPPPREIVRTGCRRREK